MKIAKLLLISLLILSVKTQAQSDSSSIKNGSVKFVQLDELERLLEVRKAINRKKCPNLLKGYRVQIFSCSGIDCMEKITTIQLKFSKSYPTIAVAKIWDAPSHKLRVGNCRNRFDAEEIKKLIQNEYASIFIVPDFIDSPFKLDCDK